MSTPKMTREQLGVKAGDEIVLKGKVSFARVDKLVDGEALTKENERRAKLGMLATKPFRAITIEDVEVVSGKGTPLANFHGQSVYQNKNNGKNTISLESKSLFPPKYAQLKGGVMVEMEDPKKNPAPGQEVYIKITAYKPKGWNNLGSTFDAIAYVGDEIKWYESAGGSLAGFGQLLGVAVEGSPVTETTEAPEGPIVSDYEEETAAPVAATNPFGAQPASGQPTVNPFA